MQDAEIPAEGAPQPVPPPPPKPRRRYWSIHLGLISAYPVVVGLASVGRSRENGPALTHGARGMLLVCSMELGIFVVIFALAWLASRFTANDLMLRTKRGFFEVLFGFGYSIGLRVFLMVAAVLLCAVLLLSRIVSLDQLKNYTTENAPDIGSLVDLAALKNNPAYFWLNMTIASFVLGGLREELWRASFLAGMANLWPGTFGSRAGQIGAVAAAAVIFGLGHLMQGAVGVVQTGILGFGLGLIMVFHRSIWPAVVAHGLFDATSFAILAGKVPGLTH